ncbi:MAG: thiopeptide-type bacteriocin biosynthesis protein, partial [Acidimicrobiia bacterium]
RPDAVFAEVVHVPGGRVSNLRPVLRDYEIPYLGRSGALSTRQISVTDLHLSIRQDRVVLRSQRLDREVIPRLTSAHNYSQRSVRMYRFLGALGEQGVASRLEWDWGRLSGAPFLPRVTTGRTVLARARWNLTAADRGLLATPNGALGQFVAVQEWRDQRNLPRYVALVDDDRELVLDLDNILCVQVLAYQVRKSPTSGLEELFLVPGELAVSGPEGRFAHEMVVPFVRKPAVDGAVGSALPRPAPSSTRRRFPPGSEWLYAKLYTGEATADRVLVDTVWPLVSSWLTAGIVDGWFFVREADPESHLRLRFHGAPDRLHGEALPGLTAAVSALVDDGRLWRIVMDTYEREVERYGGDQGIELAEGIFTADSAAVVSILGDLSGDAGLDARWRLALYGIDALFDDFEFSLEEKLSMARQARGSYQQEFGTDAEFKARLGRRFRRERLTLEALLAGDESPPALARGRRVLRRRSEQIRPLAKQLRALSAEDALSVTLVDIARSLSHMHVGRMLRSAQRPQEFVLYELLERLYRSMIARRSNP